MNIRQFQAGDETSQLQIYNTAAAGLARFKPATIVDIQRRVQAKDFDPTTRFYAVENGKTVAYCTYQLNGRVGYPWHLQGHEAVAEPLFAHALAAMKARGINTAFCAYRQDWPSVTEFFAKRDFKLAREMVNFVMRFEDMPTPSARMGTQMEPARPADVPSIFALDPSAFRVKTAEALQDALFKNPWLKPESIYVLRARGGDSVSAAGIFVTDNNYADPRAVDPLMPCFRLGAFGTEGMTTKRVKGLFSFVARPDRSLHAHGMDLLCHATNRLQDDDEIACYAAQVASDVPALFGFYQRTFERQGSFPVYERDLTK